GRGSVADLLGGSAADVDLLELPFGEEAEETAVGGPERTGRPLGPGQRLGGKSVEGPQPDLCLARGIRRVEGEVLAVGRDSRHVDGDNFGRRRDLEAGAPRRNRRAPDVADGQEAPGGQAG